MLMNNLIAQVTHLQHCMTADGWRVFYENIPRVFLAIMSGEKLPDHYDLPLVEQQPQPKLTWRTIHHIIWQMIYSQGSLHIIN